MKERRKHSEILTKLLLGIVLAMSFQPSRSVERRDSFMIRKILNYTHTVDTSNIQGSTTYAYTKYTLNVKKRNLALLAVPSMYAIAHGKKRKYITEAYEKVMFKGLKKYETQKVLEITTIPHRSKSMSTVLKYLTPEIYHETIIENTIFSPFHTNNIRFYKYYVSFLPNGTSRVVFKPKYKNTQLVEGQAMVDGDNGRVISATFSGEYDMVRFNMAIKMGDRSEEHTSELQSRQYLVCRLLLEKKKISFKDRIGSWRLTIVTYSSNGLKMHVTFFCGHHNLITALILIKDPHASH